MTKDPVKARWYRPARQLFGWANCSVGCNAVKCLTIYPLYRLSIWSVMMIYQKYIHALLSSAGFKKIVHAILLGKNRSPKNTFKNIFTAVARIRWRQEPLCCKSLIFSQVFLLYKQGMIKTVPSTVPAINTLMEAVVISLFITAAPAHQSCWILWLYPHWKPVRNVNSTPNS